MTSSGVVKDSADHRRPGFRRTVRTVVRRTVRLLGLLLVLALVIALGLNLDGLPPDAAPPLSVTEEAQLDAESRATELASDATALSAIPLSNDAPSGDAYALTAALLQQQAAALSHPVLSAPISSGRPAAPSPSESSPVGSSPAGSSPTPSIPAPTPSGFVADLFSSAQQNLHAAVAVEPGIARLLTAVGTSQRHQALTLAALQDLEVPPLGPLPAGPRAPSADCTGPAAQDTPEAQMLAEAVAAEHRTAYAYEVAAARTPDPAPLTGLAEGHTAAAVAGGELLQKMACTAPAPQLPAFALDPAFFDDPEATLTSLNTDLVRMYADLVGLTEGPARTWAIQRFTDLAGHQFQATNALEAFPGITD